MKQYAVLILDMTTIDAITAREVIRTIVGEKFYVYDSKGIKRFSSFRVGSPVGSISIQSVHTEFLRYLLSG